MERFRETYKSQHLHYRYCPLDASCEQSILESKAEFPQENGLSLLNSYDIMEAEQITCKITIAIPLPDFPNSRIELVIVLYDEIVDEVDVAIDGMFVNAITPKLYDFITESAESDFMVTLSQACTKVARFARKFCISVDEFLD